MDASDVADYLCEVSEMYGFAVERHEGTVCQANCQSVRSQMTFLGGDPTNQDFLRGIAHGLLIAFNAVMNEEHRPGVTSMAVVADAVSRIASGSDVANTTVELGDPDEWLASLSTTMTDEERADGNYRMAWKPQPWQNQRGRAT